MILNAYCEIDLYMLTFAIYICTYVDCMFPAKVFFMKIDILGYILLIYFIEWSNCTKVDAYYNNCFVDTKLNINKHIHHTTTKLSKSIGILYKIHKFFPSNTLNLLYQSFVHLYLTYGVEAWYSVN